MGIAELERVLVELLGARSEGDDGADARDPISLVSAPVFDALGRVVVVLGLLGHRAGLDAQEVERRAVLLMGVAQRTTATIGGRPPDPAGERSASSGQLGEH